MTELLQVLASVVLVGLIMGVVYGAGLMLVTIGAAVGVAILAVLVVGCVLYGLKQLVMSCFKPRRK